MGQSSEAFSDDELALVFEEADHFGQEAGRAVRVLARTAIHPSDLGSLRPANLYLKPWRGANQLWLGWRRVKNGKECTWPVASDIEDWILDWLTTPRPQHRSTWNLLLKQVEHELEKRGYSFTVCPRRFRHTAIVRLIQMGVPVPEVCRMAGVTMRTLETYGSRQPGAVAEAMFQQGW